MGKARTQPRHGYEFYIMHSSWDQILDPNNPLADRVSGALEALDGKSDFANGAYQFRTSDVSLVQGLSAGDQFNYNEQLMTVTLVAGGNTFFTYTNHPNRWP